MFLLLSSISKLGIDLLISDYFHYSSVHFLFAQKTNQKRAPKMTTSTKMDARYTGLNGASILFEVRTIFGLPTRLKYKTS